MRTLSYQRRADPLVASALVLAFVLAACAPGVRSPGAGPHTTALLRPPPPPTAMAGPNLQAVRGPIPFPFEENHGQAPADVAFLLRAGALRAAFGDRGISYRLVAADLPADPDPTSAARLSRGIGVAPRPTRAYTVEQELVGARQAAPIGTVVAPTRVNY